MSARGRPAVNRGKAAEREAAQLIHDHTGWPARRKVGEGQRLDCGDLVGVPDCTIQVVSRTSTSDLAAAMRRKPAECERQQTNAGTRYGVTLARVVPGLWLALLTDNQAEEYGVDGFGRGLAEVGATWSGLTVLTLPIWINTHREAVA